MKNTPKRMLASEDIDTLPGDRMRWDEWYKAWVRDVEADAEPDVDTITPDEEQEYDGGEMPPPGPDAEWVDDVSRTSA